MARHGGRVIVSNKLILNWLGFEGGKLHHIGKAEDLLDRVIFVIEHPDMPKVAEGELLLNVDPEYTINLAHRTWPPHIGIFRRILRAVLRE